MRARTGPVRVRQPGEVGAVESARCPRFSLSPAFPSLRYLVSFPPPLSAIHSTLLSAAYREIDAIDRRTPAPPAGEAASSRAASRIRGSLREFLHQRACLSMPKHAARSRLGDVRIGARQSHANFRSWQRGANRQPRVRRRRIPAGRLRSAPAPPRPVQPRS